VVAGAVAGFAVWGLDPVDRAGSLDDAGLFSPALPQPKKVTSKPSSTITKAFLSIRARPFLTTSVGAVLTTPVDLLLTTRFTTLVDRLLTTRIREPPFAIILNIANRCS
jgi:hypothetical protein